MYTSARLALVALLGCSLTLPRNGLTQGAMQPSLKFVLGEDKSIQISWPSNAQSFVLEQSGTVYPRPSWQPVTQSPVVQGEFLTLAISPTDRVQFFRLHMVQGAATFRLSGFTLLVGAMAVG